MQKTTALNCCAHCGKGCPAPAPTCAAMRAKARSLLSVEVGDDRVRKLGQREDEVKTSPSFLVQVGHNAFARPEVHQAARAELHVHVAARLAEGTMCAVSVNSERLLGTEKGAAVYTRQLLGHLALSPRARPSRRARARTTRRLDELGFSGAIGARKPLPYVLGRGGGQICEGEGIIPGVAMIKAHLQPETEGQPGS